LLAIEGSHGSEIRKIGVTEDEMVVQKESAANVRFKCCLGEGDLAPALTYTQNSATPDASNHHYQPRPGPASESNNAESVTLTQGQ
jgi:hypothetical protein